MTKHIPDMEPKSVADQAARQDYVRTWIARQQRKLAAGLGGSVLVLPLLAQAQTAELVDASSINGVTSVEVAANGSAQITLANGQIVTVAAAEVTVAANGAVLISASAAQLIAEIALAAGLGAGTVAGVAAGLGAGVAAAAAGGGGDEPAIPVLNQQGLAGENPLVAANVFGSFPPLEEGDRVFLTLGAEGEEIAVTITEDGEIVFPPELDLGALQGNQTVSFRVERDVEVPRVGEDGEPVLDENDEPIIDTVERDVATGSTTIVVDTIAPVITINDPIAGDDVLNLAERGQGLTLSGTTDAENGQIVTVTVNGEDYQTTVQNGAWTLTIPPSVLAGFADGAQLRVTAIVTDAAGNQSRLANASFDTDFTAQLTLNPVTIETINRFTGITIEGSATGIEAGQAITVNFNGTDYPATRDGNSWSADIPAGVIAALTDGANVAISASASDVAGNPASVSGSSAVDFSGPELSITNRIEGGFINAADAAAPIVVTGVTIPGAAVTVTLGSTVADPVTADATTGLWTVSFPVGSLPGADGAFNIAVTTSVAGVPGPSLTRGQVLDTVAPEITINAISGDNVLNAAEQGAALTISGTTTAGDGRPVTVTFNGVDYPTTAAGANWSVSVPTTGLTDGATLAVSAAVSDPAGNPATPATANLVTDFSAVVSIDAFSVETINRFTGVTVRGGTTGVEEGRTVTVTFDGQNYTGSVGADGSWSALIPANVIEALVTDTPFAISVAVSDAAGNPASSSANTTTDFSTPALVILSPTTGGFLNATTAAQNLVVSGAAVAGSEVTVTLTGGAFRTIEAGEDNTWFVTFAPGDLPETVDGVFSINASTTLGGTPISAPAVSLTIDVTPPAAPVIALVQDTGSVGDDGVTSNGQITVTGLEGTATREFRIGDGAWTAFTGTSFTLPQGAGQQVQVRTTDAAGNGPVVSNILTVTVDTTAPAAPVVTLDNDTGTVAGTTSDGSLTVNGLEDGTIREISLDGGTNWAPLVGSNFELPADGSYQVLVRQTDLAGNVATSAPALSVTLDTVAPPAPTPALVQDTGTVAGRTSNAEVVVTGLEDGSIRQYSLDGINWTTFTGDRFTPGTDQGAYTVQVRQIDGAGNISADNLLMFTLDTVAPATPTLALVQDTAAVDGITSNGAVTVTGLEEGSIREFSVNGGDFVAFTGTTLTALQIGADGVKSVVVRQTDGAGNVSGTSVALNFTLDTVAPATPTLALVADTAAADGITSNGAVNVTGLEEGSIREFSVNGGDFAAFTGTTLTAAQIGADGVKSVVVRQTDGAGNVSGTSVALNFTLDTTAPATPTLALVADTAAADGITSNGAVNVTGLEEGSIREFSVNGGDFAAFTGTTLTAAQIGADGVKSVVVRQTDAAGNVSGPSVALNFTLDTEAPEVSIDSIGGIASGQTFTAANLLDGGNNPLVTIPLLGRTNAPDGTTITVTSGGQTLTTQANAGTWTLDIPVETANAVLGNQVQVTINAAATDVAGNTGTGQLSINVDLSVPTIAITSPAVGVTLGLAEFDAGFSVTGTTENVAQNAVVTINFTQTVNGAPVVTTTTATVGADGSFTGNFTPAQVKALADQLPGTISVSVTDPSYPIAATAQQSATVNIPPSLEVDPFGVDGAIVFVNGAGPATVTLSGTTQGVQQGQTVELRDAGNAVIAQTTVLANGTFTMDVTVPPGFGPGSALTGSVVVANASGRSVSETGTVVGYEAADYYVSGGTPAAGGAQAFTLFLDPRLVLPGDLGIGFGETMTFDPAVATFVTSPQPSYVAGVTRVVNTSQAATGQVTFGGVGFLDDTEAVPDPYAVPMITFRMVHVNTAADIVMVFDSQVGGNYDYVYGADTATTITAGTYDATIRARGGDDTINLEAPGVHTVIFETTQALNGEDTITGFDLGSALADRIAFHGLDNTTLRGDGSDFQLVTSGTAIGANTGFAVITNSIDIDSDAVVTDALNGLGLGTDDIVYLLVGTDAESVLVRIQMDGNNLPALEDIETLGVFDGMGATQRAGFTADNILGFEPVVNVV